MTYLEAVIARCQNTATEDQLREYIQQTDKIIFRVYKKRFPFQMKKDPITGISEVKTSIPCDYNTFAEKCWALMEEKGLLRRICAYSFPEDKYLSGYIKTAFEHQLQDYVYDQLPGFNTRIRQLNRVMSRFSRKEIINQDIFWTILGFRPEQKKLLSNSKELDQLRKHAAKLKLPECHYPQDSDTDRGIQISDDEMESFLKSLLEAMGGQLRHNNLIRLIVKLYCLFPVTFVSTFNSKNDEDEEQSEDFDYKNNPETPDIYLSMDLIQTARQINQVWESRWKCIFLLKYVYEHKQIFIAKKLGISNASVSQLVNRIETAFAELHLEKQWDIEEYKEFMKLLKKLILEGPNPCPT